MSITKRPTNCANATNSSDTAVAPSDDPVTTFETTADQQEVYQVIRQYEAGLNAGDTNAIVNLFADDGVAEWNNKPTYATRQQKIDGHNELFKMILSKAKAESKPYIATPVNSVPVQARAQQLHGTCADIVPIPSATR
jgi:hypothetical protein